MQTHSATPRERINGMMALLGGTPATIDCSETDSYPDAHIMSSKDISKATEKRHDHVIRDIRVMIEDLKKAPPSLGAEYNQGLTEVIASNKMTQEFLMSRSMVELLVTGYSTIHRAKALSRLRELEAIVASRTPVAPAPRELTRRELALMVVAAEDEIAAKDAQIAADAPKVKFAEAVRDTDASNSLNEVAKTLGWGRTKFMKQLRDDKILMDGSSADTRKNEPYQKYIDLGYFTFGVVDIVKRSDGTEQIITAARVTGKGLVWLEKKYGRKHTGQQRLC